MLGHTYVWDVSRGRILQTFKAGGPLAISSDGRFVALAQNTEDDPTNTEAGMALLDLRTGAVSELQGGLNATIGTMSFTPDGRSIIAGSAGPADNNIYLWDLRAGADKGRIMQTFSGQAGAQDAIAMTPDGSTFFSGANDGSVIAWDLTGSQRLGRTVTWGPQWIGCYDAPCVVINHQGTLMAASRGVDGSTTLVDLRKLQSIGKLVVKNTAGGEAMAFFPDGQTLATGYWRADRDGQFKSGGVTVWNTQTRRALHTFARSNWADRLAVSPDGKSLAMLTPYLDGSWHVQLWDMPTWKLVRTFAAPAGAGLGDNIAFSPDGRELAVSGTDVKVWDTSSGKKLFDLGISGRYEVAFSPDSKLLAVGTGDGQVMMLDARSGAPSGSPLNAAGAVYGISFSPNEELIALSTNDLTVSLWDVRSSQRVGTFRTEGTGPGGYFLSNGDLVVVAEGWVALWPVDVQSWVDYACQIAGRDLTPDEWSQLLPNRPYQPTCPASTI
jgi:WD40 repeat protein